MYDALKNKRFVVLYGPTASGKTNFAIDLAQKLNAIIVNVDSLQLFFDLKILTARPTDHEMASCPHYLYGILKPNDQPTVMIWLNNVLKIIEEQNSDKKIILVGGTGLYISSFLDGIAPIPEIDPEIQAFVKEKAATLKDAFFEFAVSYDPNLARMYHQNNIKRLSRGLGVFLTTKTSIKEYLELPHLYSFKKEAFKIYIKPDREVLHKRIEHRFQNMLTHGAIDEIEVFLKKYDINQNLPILNALGAKELIHYVKGTLKKEEMISQSIQKTRQYAKRQFTWFNNQIKADSIITI
ncbi:MAG: tRNA dimethylallyltransferase [Holosporales bacterium]